MPDTDRRWPSSQEMAARLMQRVENLVSPEFHSRLSGALSAYFASGGMVIERKLARLTESLKDAIENEAFGPLFVNDDGEPIARDTVTDPEAVGVNPTQAYRIWRAFKNIYSMEVLDQVDEEGNPLW